MLRQAAQHGTHLVVGVHSDDDCEGYKRRPVATLDERCQSVAACRYVRQVIRSAPLVLTPEFLQRHSIHTVVLSPEYDTEDDMYYAAARELGLNMVVLPRTPGVSTSELIQRVLEREGTSNIPQPLPE